MRNGMDTKKSVIKTAVVVLQALKVNISFELHYRHCVSLICCCCWCCSRGIFLRTNFYARNFFLTFVWKWKTTHLCRYRSKRKREKERQLCAVAKELLLQIINIVYCVCIFAAEREHLLAMYYYLTTVVVIKMCFVSFV